MYAVIRTGGKQYRVAEGDVLRIEKIAGDSGVEVKFAEVLMVGGTDAPRIGKPTLAGAVVAGKILRQARLAAFCTFAKRRKDGRACAVIASPSPR